MQKLNATLITPPAVPLLTLDEVRQHVKRDDDDDDAVLTGLIAVAMSRLDGDRSILGRCLINQTWAESWCDFPVGTVLPLGLAPVVSVASISYFDADDQEQTFAGPYAAHNRPGGAYVKLGRLVSWPSSYERDDAVTVTYIAGYGATADAVPAEIKHAAKMLIADWYFNRDTATIGEAPMPVGVMSLLRRFIRPHF